MDRQTLIVVGGGAAGLMAARELADRYNIILLEARPQLGGRIRSLHLEDDPSQRVEAGAEFIHGSLPLTLQLLKEAGISRLPVEGKMYRKEKGAWDEQTEMMEEWDQLLGKMKRLEEDMTMHDFLQLYFSGNEYADLRRHVTAFTEGFDIADIKKASVRSLYKEWSKESGENFRVQGGYGALIDFLKEECEKKGCRILTSQTVKQIDWEKNEVTVYTATGKYNAEKLIVTVPLGVLRSTAAAASINFTPPLDDYIKAAAEIGFGAVIKIVLQFQHRFWQEDAGFFLSDELIPTWWTQFPDTAPVLTGWAGGTRAEQLSVQMEDELLQKALFSLAAIFDKTTGELKKLLREAKIFNWQPDEYTMGAYSYAMPGTELARRILQTPVAGTVFFAGEALYDGSSGGTVEAALVSGKEAAEKCKM